MDKTHYMYTMYTEVRGEGGGDYPQISWEIKTHNNALIKEWYKMGRQGLQWF